MPAKEGGGASANRMDRESLVESDLRNSKRISLKEENDE